MESSLTTSYIGRCVPPEKREGAPVERTERPREPAKGKKGGLSNRFKDSPNEKVESVGPIATIGRNW